jgi:hypothetical protein
MALFKITVKRSGVTNGLRLEKGMSVDVPSKYTNPVVTNGGHEVQDAFLRVYGIDLKKANCLSMNYLDVQKIN